RPDAGAAGLEVLVDRGKRDQAGKCREKKVNQPDAVHCTPQRSDNSSGRLVARVGSKVQTRLPALQLQKSRPSSRMNFASTILCTSSAPSTSRAARAAR